MATFPEISLSLTHRAHCQVGCQGKTRDPIFLIVFTIYEEIQTIRIVCASALCNCASMTWSLAPQRYIDTESVIVSPFDSTVNTRIYSNFIMETCLMSITFYSIGVITDY